MALETWARCASWLGNNRTLLTCCHCLIINNNNYHVRRSALGFSKHLSCDGWKCSWVPGPRATQPQGAPDGLRFPRRCSRYLQPAGLCRCCRTQRPAGCSTSIAPRSSSPVRCKLQKGTGSLRGARKALGSCSWCGRGAASCGAFPSGTDDSLPVAVPCCCLLAPGSCSRRQGAALGTALSV